MLTRLSILLLTFLTAAITVSCPFIRRARKGILFIHFVFLHSAQAWNDLDSDLPLGADVLSTLSAFALLYVLVEHALTLNEPETDFFLLVDALPFIFALAGFDSLAIFLHWSTYAITNLLLCFGICAVCFYLRCHPRQSVAEMSISDLTKITDGTFFYDSTNPFNCVGRQGFFHIALTICRLLIGMSPYIASKKGVRDVFIVAECVATWLILALPVVFGGFVQTAKITGRYIVEIQLRRRMIEAEKSDREQHKHRRHEEMLASVEEMYGDEAILKELI